MNNDLHRCCFCEETNDLVEAWQVVKYDWLRDAWLPFNAIKIYAHPGCLYKEKSANGDGCGERLTA